MTSTAQPAGRLQQRLLGVAWNQVIDTSQAMLGKVHLHNYVPAMP